MELNETPIRTSKNFLINNIKLDIEIPNNIKEFEDIQITKTNSEICFDTKNTLLTYGISKKLEKLNYTKSNSNIKIESKENDNIKITYNFDEDNTELLNVIEVNAYKNLNLVIEYKSNTDKKCFHNGILKVLANENSKINITILNLLNENTDNFESIENTLYSNSKTNYTIIDIGGKTSISNYYSNILGENANNDLKTIYLGTGEQLKDINYIAEIKGPKSKIDIDVQGALKDTAKKNFKGTIDFKKGSKKAIGNENEYCMLLSNKAKSIALPMLLCTEEDVEGNHSTASGKVDNKELFYIMTRGFSYKEAVKLIVKARFNKILDRITDEELKEKVVQEIDKRLN